MRVFIVWEPVLATDWGSPSRSLPGFVADPRARHYWDPDRRLSAEFGGVGALDRLAGARSVGFRMKDVIWDIAVVYPPGLIWGQPGTALFAPVVKFREQLAASF